MKVKPVMLPPGRDRLATKPCPTGSLTTLNTIGMVPRPASRKIRGSTPCKANCPRQRVSHRRLRCMLAPTVHSAPWHDPLPLPAYRGDRLAFAPHTAGLWPELFYVGLTHGSVSHSPFAPHTAGLWPELFYVGLTHGSVSHSRTPASRSSGGFMIPTTPCPPGCMWTCRTSTVCLLPRR
jgi:hypothetical protein